MVGLHNPEETKTSLNCRAEDDDEKQVPECRTAQWAPNRILQKHGQKQREEKNEKRIEWRYKLSVKRKWKLNNARVSV